MPDTTLAPARPRRRSGLFALSRSGAVAALLTRRPVRCAASTGWRAALLLGGAVVIGLGVAVTLRTGLGPGPIDTFVAAVRGRTGLPLAPVMWSVSVVLVSSAWRLGRRPGVGTIVCPLVMGPVVQVADAVLATIDIPNALALQVALHVAGIGLIGLGAAALIVSGLGAGSGELLAIAASDRTGHSQPRIRLLVETTWLATGIALGGPAGAGTVLVALLIGPAVATGYRVMSRMVTGPLDRLDARTAPVFDTGELTAIAA